METTSALTKNTFKSQIQTSGKLSNLDSQIVELQEDYEEMKKTREEAKQALQAKFDDVYNKIKQTKEYILQESVQTNNSMVEFQHKFDTEIKVLEIKHNQQHTIFVAETDKRLARLQNDLETLDRGIEEEKQDRINTERMHVEEIQKQLNTLTKNFNWERTTRVDNEQKILDKIKGDCLNLSNAITNEQDERIKKVEDLDRHVKHELDSQDRFLANFRKKTIDEFAHQTEHIQDEMNNRFEHQNELVDNLRGTTATIQETLKILGKDI